MYHDYVVKYTSKSCANPNYVFETGVRADDRNEAMNCIRDNYYKTYRRKGMVKIVSAKHDSDCYICRVMKGDNI